MLWLEAFIALVIGLVVINGLLMLLKLSKKHRGKLQQLFSGAYVLIIIFGTASYVLESANFMKKHKRPLTFVDFLNGGSSKELMKRLLVGVGSGVVFGAIDNAGLWFGMESLIPILPKGELTQAGYGNVFSDSLSAFLATFAGSIIANLTGVTGELPVWGNALGTFIGCLIGLHGCRALTGKI